MKKLLTALFLGLTIFQSSHADTATLYRRNTYFEEYGTIYNITITNSPSVYSVAEGKGVSFAPTDSSKDMYVKRNDSLYYKCFAEPGDNREAIGYVYALKGSDDSGINGADIKAVIQNPDNNTNDLTANQFDDQFCDMALWGQMGGNYENYDGSWIDLIKKVSGYWLNFTKDCTASFRLLIPIYGEQLSGASEFMDLSGETLS